MSIASVATARTISLSLSVELGALAALDPLDASAHGWRHAIGHELPPLAAPVGTLGTLNALSVLAISAVRTGVPVVTFIRELALRPALVSPTTGVQGPLDVRWAVVRTWRPHHTMPFVSRIDFSAKRHPDSSLELAYDIEAMAARRITLGSPLELVITLP